MGGRLVIDPAKRMPGRGAYTCADAECLRKALRKHGLQRTLRADDLVVDENDLTGALKRELESTFSREIG